MNFDEPSGKLTEFDTRQKWQTQTQLPLVFLKNKFMPLDTYIYHLHERDSLGEKGKAGLLKINFPMKILTIGTWNRLYNKQAFNLLLLDRDKTLRCACVWLAKPF